MSAPRLILASASPRRADALRQLGLDPEIVPADLDESYLEGESPAEHVERLAREKAGAVARAAPDALVVGGDTVVVDRGAVLGKPRDADHAIEMLTGLSGHAHEVITGIALAGPHGTLSRAVRTSVRFRTVTPETARLYTATGEPLDKAGAYGIQGLGAALVEGVDGDYYCVMGFPIAAFMDLLAGAGWRYEFGRLSRIERS